MNERILPNTEVDTGPPVFPADRFPEQARDARLLGIYPQRQPGRYMQRVRVPGGLLRAAQWRALARIARELTPQTPLHLTTRQDIELHDLAAQDVPRAQQALAEAGLTTLGSGGDTLRNITVCPCAAGGTADAPDLLPLAHAIGRALAEYEPLFCLPRKFKLSLSGCREACGRPYVHDLAFVAVREGDRWRLKAIGAGSLGPKPVLGIVLAERIEPGEAPALALAAVRLFARHGDRQNRSQARLRHVRQRMGDAAFLEALVDEFEAARRQRRWPEIALVAPVSPSQSRRVLACANGDLSPEAAEALAELAGAGHSVRIGQDHCVYLFGAEERLQAGIELHAALAGLAPGRHKVITCPGTRWCARALTDTNALADRVRDALPAPAEGELMIAISGCPNGCAHSAVADIGLVGGRSVVEGRPTEVYHVLAGGGRGSDATLARTVAKALPTEEALARVIELARGGV